MGGSFYEKRGESFFVFLNERRGEDMKGARGTWEAKGGTREVKGGTRPREGHELSQEAEREVKSCPERL